MLGPFHHKAGYKTIDEAAEKAILRLHHQHPEMGRKRLHTALEESGVTVDAQDLKRFLRSHGIGTPPATGQTALGWGYTRLPHIPWLKYRPGR